MSKVEDTFSAEEIAAGHSLITSIVRDMAKRGHLNEETCIECEATTDWSEAMYDLLAKGWVCPKCWDSRS